MKRFWLSWEGALKEWPDGLRKVDFELHTPWWISGYGWVEDPKGEDGEAEQPMICAAVRAESEAAAKALVVAAHDEPVELEWRFVQERPADWSPFSGRFPRADWMVWP